MPYSQKIEDKIKFIDDYKHLYDVRVLCKCLNIHPSVYYYHCNHLTNSYIESNKKLDIEIKKYMMHPKEDMVRLKSLKY